MRESEGSETSPPRIGARRRGLTWRNQTMVSLPARSRTWSKELAARFSLALLLLALNTAIVYLDRASYVDLVGDEGVSLIDAFYYTTVTITTTGYGDITPVAEHARLLNALVVTPLRIAFLVLLVGTTLEVLATEGRRALLDSRWRKKMKGHTVVIGYGTMGQRAASTLMDSGLSAEKIVVIDMNREFADMANRHGLAAFVGDAANRDLLRRAEVPSAREVIITTGRDDAAILATLTVRQLNPTAHIVVAVRKLDNIELAEQSGANSVVTSSDSVGRLVALASINENLSNVVEDLLDYGDGLDVCQRTVADHEVGLAPVQVRADPVLAVVRKGVLHRFTDPAIGVLEADDELVVIRDTSAHGDMSGACAAAEA